MKNPTRLLDGAPYVPADETDIRKRLPPRKPGNDFLDAICGLHMRHFALALLRSRAASVFIGNPGGVPFTLDSVIRAEWPDGVTNVEHLRQTVTAAKEMAMAMGKASTHDQLALLPQDVKRLLSLEVHMFALSMRARFNSDIEGPYIIGSRYVVSENDIVPVVGLVRDKLRQNRHVPVVAVRNGIEMKVLRV